MFSQPNLDVYRDEVERNFEIQGKTKLISSGPVMKCPVITLEVSVKYESKKNNLQVRVTLVKNVKC